MGKASLKQAARALACVVALSGVAAPGAYGGAPADPEPGPRVADTVSPEFNKAEALTAIKAMELGMSEGTLPLTDVADSIVYIVQHVPLTDLTDVKNEAMTALREGFDLSLKANNIGANFKFADAMRTVGVYGDYLPPAMPRVFAEATRTIEAGGRFDGPIP